MNKTFIHAVAAIALLSSCANYVQDLRISKCSPSIENINQNYSRAASIDNALQELVNNGVPGAAMAVYSDEGWWASAAGYAKIEDKTPMQTCHLQYLQSVAKTYMAVAILKLYEEGKINLDEPITRYLPEKYSRYVADASRVTVKMLLNHTSGIPEYNGEPNYVSYLLQHPDHYFTTEDYLRYIDNKPLKFTPGTKYSYSNTNYELLALIGDAVTGDHAQYIKDVIIKPLGLTSTFYRGDEGYLNYPNLVNSYWDRHSDGVIENASQLQRNNVMAMVGDDGVVATPVDAIKFLKGLVEGKLLSPATLNLMKTWVNNSKGEPTYGLGLDYTTSDFLKNEAYGHGGGGIGAGCYLYYIPKKNVYFFIGINLGTVTDSPLHKAASEKLEMVWEGLLK